MSQTPEFRILSNQASAERHVNRRQVIQFLLGGAGAGIAALPLLPAEHPVHKHLASEATMAAADAKAVAGDWAPEFLSAHQNQTLIALAERIIPGATPAQANRFIDLLLSVDTQDNQKRFLNALSALEAESLTRFGHPFVALSEAQQNELLTLASTAAPARRPEDEVPEWLQGIAANPSAGPPPQTLRDCFEHLKGWVSGAYYSSEIGMRELGWTGNSFFESFPGCQHPEGHP